MFRTFAAVAVLSALSTLTPPLAAQATAAGGKPAIPAAAATRGERDFQRFVAEVGGQWQARWCRATGTPSAIFGTGLPLATGRATTLADAREAARRLFEERSDLLGLGDSEFREAVGEPVGWTWCLRYDQFFRGLPAIGGRADVRVNRAGRIAMFGSRAWPIPADFETVPTLTDEIATALAWQALAAAPPSSAQPGRRRDPRLVIWGDVDADREAPFHLAWEIPIAAIAADGSGPAGRSYVDAHSGAVLRFESDKHECGVAGCTDPTAHGRAATPATAPALAPIDTTCVVQAWTRLGTSALEPLTLVPLADVRVTVPGKGVYTTDANGEFIVPLTAAVAVTAELRGTHTDLVDGSNRPTALRIVTPGQTAYFTFLYQSAPVTLAAHPTTYYWTNRTNVYLRSVLGNTPAFTVLDGVEPTVNLNATCNAYYYNNTINFYGTGGGCNNTAFSSVVAHEWGHGLDERYGGISQLQGLGEGWADTIAMYTLGSPLVGEDFQTGSVLRDGNNTVQYPAGGGVHNQGKTWMGFCWKVRSRLIATLGNNHTTVALASNIVLDTVMADARNQPDAVLEVFLADDNDGNLQNGTPHDQQLIWAANQHNLPIPAVGPPANDLCSNAIPLENGVNGPFRTTGAMTSTTWPCPNIGADVWFTYDAGVAGTLTVQTCNHANFDTAIEILSGPCSGLSSLGCNDDACGTQSMLTVPVGAGTYYIRVGGSNGTTGEFDLVVSGPPAATATVTPYGVGCYPASRSFYEHFESAGEFDLAGSAMRLRFQGDHYRVEPGGSYVPPPVGAAVVPLTTGTPEATVNLPGGLAYPGGATPRLRVHLDGFASAAPGNLNGSPSPSSWLSSPVARWGSWSRFWTPASTPGAVLRHTQNGVLYLTWYRMPAFLAQDENTFQLQFDTNTEDVTFAWGAMDPSYGSTVVGFAAAGPANDLGSVDISAQLPNGFRTWPIDGEPLTLSATVPVLGSNLVFTTTDYPAGSPLGIQLLSLVKLNRGPELGSAGMPDCYQLVGASVNSVMFPSNGQSTYSMQLPLDPSYVGLSIHGQSAAVAVGANPTGLVLSNGVSAFLGL
ncbi:MAG: hypothetical protein KDE27_05565 [Planctomycetes bacterium]|nr:hypothetical protein [Planctomycetota bacterium]